MGWAETIVQAYKESGVDLIAYVPDNSLAILLRIMESDTFFKLVPASREEEGVGIASGAYAAGRKAGVFLQSSGLGNCINALCSLNLACRIPVPLLINLRGDVGDTSTAQFPMGRATMPILDVLGISHFLLTEESKLHMIVAGAIKSCYASHQPVGIIMSPLLHGGKGA